VGIDTEWLDAPEIAARCAWLNMDGVAGAAFERFGGYADPVQAVEAYIAAFRRIGGELRLRTPVRKLLRDGDRLTGVLTDEAAISAGMIVNAAGPWAPALAQLAGIALPIRSIREQDTVWEARAGRELPAWSVSNSIDAIYIRPQGERRYIVGRGFPKEYEDVDENNYKQTPDDSFITDVQTRLEHRIPAMQGARLVHAYTALYDVTPDWYPFVGPRGDLGNYADFSGGSGHGFKIAPGIAEELAGWLLTGNAAGDFRQLSHDRIGTGRLFVQSYGGNRG
jgi:sarcosine oxidase subunit beta